jgi:hypothetical protein
VCLRSVIIVACCPSFLTEISFRKLENDTSLHYMPARSRENAVERYALMSLGMTAFEHAGEGDDFMHGRDTVPVMTTHYRSLKNG